MTIRRAIAKTAEIIDHELSNRISPITYLVGRRLKHVHLYTRKEYVCKLRRMGAASPPSLVTTSFPGVLALLFVMFERGIETANHFAAVSKSACAFGSSILSMSLRR